LKWQWAGYVARMNSNRWTSRIFKWRPWESKRKLGRPMKRWADDIKAAAGRNWTQEAQDRDVWKRLEDT